ncbi:glycosyltransferase family 4 protein [Candidatus Roizmanbacteria bacterium]|nr:glycosyltransferase family 4 protein [Candidatus Roizmanbacteria bacterium]
MEIVKGCLQVNEDLSITGGAEIMVRQIGLELSRRKLNVGLVSAHEFRDLTGLKEYIIPFFNGHYPSERIPELAHSVIDIMDDQGYDLLHVYSVTNHELIQEIAKSKPVFRSVYDSRPYCPIENRIKFQGNICTEPVGVNCLECMEQFGIPEATRIGKLSQTASGLESMESYRFIFTPSEYVRQQLILNKIPSQKLVVIPLFLAHTPVISHGVMESLVTAEASDILFVGRLVEIKGIDELLSAFSLLENKYKLTVIGNRPSYVPSRDFEKENQLNDRVKFLGWVDTNLIDAYYQRTRICVVPSIWPESFGLVGLHAMKNKKPVVAFNTGGISEWLHDGENGYLIPRGDINLFAEKMRFLLENPKKAEEMGEIGYQILSNQFTVKAHIDRLLHYYNEGLK